MSIDNYEYILELVDMNHFNRGLQRSSQKKTKITIPHKEKLADWRAMLLGEDRGVALLILYS
ncbi:hypothetical protein GCM10020331_066370 [Ectobacillus funiculus]